MLMAWCTLAALAGTCVVDPAARAMASIDSFVKPISQLADAASLAGGSGLPTFSFGAMSAASMVKAPFGDGGPKPGEGPSAEERMNGRYDVLFVGEMPDGERIRYGVKGRYDPGYGSTSRMIAETGIARRLVALLRSNEGEDGPAQGDDHRPRGQDRRARLEWNRKGEAAVEDAAAVAARAADAGRIGAAAEHVRGAARRA